MIELPDFAVPTSRQASFMSAGFNQSGLQSDAHIARKGSRYQITQTFGPYGPEDSRIMEARLITAKESGGLRVQYHLLHNQGSPGEPLLDGAVSTGKGISLKNLTPGYFCKEGFWLSLVKDDLRCLHKVATGGRAAADGTLDIVLAEMVRDSFPDEAEVHLAKPMVEGLIQGDGVQWSTAASQLTPFEVTMKELR